MKILSFLLLTITLGLSTEALCATPLEQGIAAYKSGEEAKAIKILQPLAVRGDAQAQYYLGLSYEYSPEATKWFQKAADQGHAKAQYFLYSQYRDGIGVTQDSVLAYKWLQRAAAGGSDSAQYSLGLESAMAGSPGEAAKWYRLAAAQGHDKAQLMLARLYWDGQGIERNVVRAYMWLLLSAETGNQTAKEEHALAEKRALTPQQVAQGRAKAQLCKSSSFKNCD